MTKSITAIIPARGGSSGLKDKNLLMLGDKPIVCWTVEAALKSKLNSVVLSTDDPRIRNAVSNYNGLQVIDQPSPMKDGLTNAVHVLLWYLRTLNDANVALPDGICMLLPTSPLRTHQHINGAIEKFNRGAKVVVSVCSSKPLHSVRRVRNGFLAPVEAGDLNAQRQDVEPIYEVNGSIYIAQPEILLKHQTFHVEQAVPYKMGVRYSIDVNTQDDLDLLRKMIT